MPSPFPGMNPYFEQPAAWQDFHHGFIYVARAALIDQVLPAYFVKIEEHIFIQEVAADERRPFARPDLSLFETPAWAASESNSPGGVAAPAYVQLPAVAVIPERHSFLEIRDRQDMALVTVLELLSPSNKWGSDRAGYVEKRRQYLESGVNLVELDLLRGGPRLPMKGLPPECDYYAMVARPAEAPRAGIWAWRLREQMPAVPIPLRPADHDARLNLQEVLHRAYDESGYAGYIYLTPPERPLGNEDAAWAAEILGARS